MAEPKETKNVVPDFTMIFTRMKEAVTEDVADSLELIEEQKETIRILQEGIPPDSDTPYVTTFMSV